MKRAVKAIILDEKGYALMLRRSGTHPSVPFTPDIPGGIIEPGEDVLDTLAREVLEETGLAIADKTIRYVGSHKSIWHGLHAEMVLYEVSGYTSQPTVTIDFEHDKVEWVPVKELTHVGFFDQLVKQYVADNS